MISETNAWLRRHKIGVAIFFFALAIRLFFILSAPPEKITTFALGADGSDYANEALNIVNGHGFSRNIQTPFLPDMIRTPIYPLVLALVYVLFNSFYPILFLQALLSSCIPLIGMSLMRLFSDKKSSVLVAGLALAIEPHMVFYTIFFTSETIFVPLFCIFIYTFVKWMINQKISYLAIASITLGVATLTRPISILIPILCIGCALILYQTHKHKNILVHIGIFILIFIATLSPWMIRNKIQFNTFSISTVGWFNVYTRFTTDIMATHNKTDFYTSYQRNLDILSIKGYVKHPPPVSELEIQKAEFMPILKKESIEIIQRYPKDFLIVSTLAALSVLTQDNTLNILETNWEIKSKRPPLSPTLYFAQNGFKKTFSYLLPYIHGTYIIPYIGRALWTLVFIMTIYGFLVIQQHNKEKKILATFLCSIIIYFIIFTINASPQIDGRYRTQFFICELVLCLVAFEHLIQYTKKQKKIS